MSKINFKKLILGILAVVAVALAGGTVGFNIKSDGEGKTEITVQSDFAIELSEEQIPAVIETEDGQIEIMEAPTVEEIDGAQLAEECGEDEECGQGWYVDISTPQTFKNATYGQCIDTDGHYGSQCWDLANLFWQNAAGRTLSTCGTGAAKGTLNCWEQNAGDEFVMVWDPTQIKTGDIVVFTNGTFGHIGMAMGSYNNGYVALLGTNQGGASCQGGGAAANIINISLKSFGGAFRYKGYIEPEPEPQPEPQPSPISNCAKWAVERGDTMSKIMLECEGTVVYGAAMDAYAKSWYSLIYKPGQSVYDGWHSKTGVGLYAGDEIEHRTGE